MANVLSDEELVCIEQSIHLLPDGPWFLDEDEGGDQWIKIPGHDLFFGNIEGTSKCCFDLARFIAKSRMDVPKLLELVKAQQARIKELEKELEDGRTYVDV